MNVSDDVTSIVLSYALSFSRLVEFLRANAARRSVPSRFWRSSTGENRHRAPRYPESLPGTIRSAAPVSQFGGPGRSGSSRIRSPPSSPRRQLDIIASGRGGRALAGSRDWSLRCFVFWSIFLRRRARSGGKVAASAEAN